MNKKCIYLTDNSPEIREELSNAGIYVCICCSFKGFGWLNYYYREAFGINPPNKEVHAVIGCDDDIPDEVRHRMFLSEAKAFGEEIIECNDVKTFIKYILEDKR